MAEETVILNLQVDQGQAERQLEKIEGILLDNKKAVQDLQAAYKKGTITQEEYVKENIRLQQNIKKEQDQKKVLIRTIETESNSRNALKNRVSQLTKEYDGLNTSTATGIKRADQLEKELAQLNSQLNKGDKAAGLFKNQIGNYPRVLQDAASNIRVAGVSVADVGTRLTALANPVTATIGLVGALGAAYARSTIGAKDFEFASNQLGNSITLTANKFAEFISSAEDGQGILSKALDSAAGAADVILDLVTFGGRRVLGFSAADINKQAKALALLAEQLQDLGRLEQEVRTNNNQLLEENQELLEKIADDETVIVEKAKAANQAEANLLIAKKNLLSVLNDELAIIQKNRDSDPNNETFLDLAIAKRREISAESRNFEKQLSKIQKQQTDLNQQVAKQVALQKEINRLKGAPTTSLSPIGPSFGGTPGAIVNEEDQNTAAIQKDRNEQFLKPLKDRAKIETDIALKGVQTVEQTEAQKREAYLKTQEIQNIADQQRFNVLQDVAQAGAALFGEQTAAYKAFASASTIISTYSAATKAYESAFLPVPTVASPALGAISAGAAIALGLANLARINGVQFAEGGFTGTGGKYEPAGIVHKGEYVVPQSVNYSPAARPHINALESMRTRGYADGGFVANQSTAPINQSLIIGNMLKNMPPVFASWTEGERIGKRVRFKENLSSLQTKPRRE